MNTAFNELCILYEYTDPNFLGILLCPSRLLLPPPLRLLIVVRDPTLGLALHPAVAWDFGSSVNFPEVVVQCVAEKIDNQSSLNHQKPHAFARLYGTGVNRYLERFFRSGYFGKVWRMQ